LPGALGSLAGDDPSLRRLLAQAGKLAPTALPLLLTGETGTGKEKLARAIHVCGPEARAFHTLRCATLADLSDLDEAAPGTLFLRGVEDLSGTAQAALLALLDRRSDLRILASARGDAASLAATLRDDLYFRLAGAVLALPPLRLRADFDWLLDRLLRRRSGGEVRLSPSARAELKSRIWPGNIRELEQALDLALTLAEGPVIDLPDLPTGSCAPRPAPDPEAELDAVLAACGWNMAQAARRLGVNRSTVMRRVRKAGLTPPN
ncbi:sigma 54-interacting transcriptional regulator, partial [Litorisediminicola beolgyonensis]